MASTSYNQIPSSSTSTPTVWDVFLSFRGKDTRYTFTDHLYKALHRTGIRTFKDDPELRSGEVIPDSLIQAIQDSKTYIVVLSENYASSSWCLDELVEIVSCYKQMKRLVVPVFYNIDPYVVRHQIESFKEAFDKHRSRFETEKVDNWRLTLNAVADFSGYHISKHRSQADIIDEVVNRISLEINPKTLYVAKYPVGLDSRVRDITALLDTNTEGIIRIGIHGMGGVGKTTLAKALYNQNYQRFQGSCFLANVREVSGTENGLVGLQHQLMVDVLKYSNLNIGNKDQGIELIRARLCSTKVLLVVDDLDNLKPLEYLEGPFALGSMIVITTRNEDLLDRIKVKAKYKVNQMDKDESRKLFTQHAFREDNISHIFTKLSNEILENAGGLPLALQVFGSTLLDESEDGWRWFIDKLKRAPVDDVEESLMISFDALKSVDLNLQDIFLDIACFYIGWKIEEVAKILETCYTFVNRKIDILQKRCLITISYQDKLGMHDLLRDMGRKIARNNSPDEPGKHSRLWVSEDIDTVLKNHKGTEAIQGIISGYYRNNYRMNGMTFVAKSFKRMSKLKFLYLNNVILTGSFKRTFEDLRWLCWTYFPLECLPSDFYAEKLVILEFPDSNIRKTWEAPREFKKLKTLNMSGSRKLETTPNFIRLPCLETLNLEDCSSLEEVHVSIGSLESLVHLNLLGCENLKSLPDSFCSLRALEVLTITSCIRLKALPTELGSIESLKTLNASGLTVSKLPDSLGRLSNLIELDLSYNENLETLPDSICKLRSLRILDTSACKKLEELPDKLGMITSLRYLHVMDDTMLRKLPDISQLSNIEHLDLNNCDNLLSIAELPTSLKRIMAKECTSLKRLPDLSGLKDLKSLDLTNCEALKDIQGLEGVTSLEVLNLWNCRSMERLPELSRLKHLKRLGLRGCRYLTDIQGLEELTSLKYLILGSCMSLARSPNLCKLKHLKRLDLRFCTELKYIQGLEELSLLEGLDLKGCYHLLSISELPTNLEWIEAIDCVSLKRLPDLSILKILKRLDLTNCIALKEIQGLEELTSLKYLILGSCMSLARSPNLCKLKHLKRLDLRFCTELKDIQGLEELSLLEGLDLKGCYHLLSLSELPTNLEWIEAIDCVSLKRLPDLSTLKFLKRLDLTNCIALKEIQGLEELTSLKYLTLGSCMSLERLPNLCKLKHLKRLDLRICTELKDIQGLEELNFLEDLDLKGCYHLLSISELPINLEWIEAIDCVSLKRLPDLSTSKNLKRLNLASCVALKEIQGLEEATSLEDLSLWNCSFIERLPNLFKLKHLKRLDLSHCYSLNEVQGLEEVTSLEELSLCNCRSIKRLPNLCNLIHLKRLDLTLCDSLREIIGLEELTSLEHLEFDFCGNLLSVSKLPPNLNWVNAEGCTSFKRLPNLSYLKQLEGLDLTNCSGLTEIQGLEELTCLKYLFMAGCNSSLLAHTLTKRFFEILSRLEHKVEISIGKKEFPNWISQPSKDGLVNKYCLDLQPNESHNFLAIILGFEDKNDNVKCSVKNITSGFIWSEYLVNHGHSSMIVIVPISILSIKDGDDRIEVTSDKCILCGIHLLYKTEITMISNPHDLLEATLTM